MSNSLKISLSACWIIFCETLKIPETSKKRPGNAINNGVWNLFKLSFSRYQNILFFLLPQRTTTQVPLTKTTHKNAPISIINWLLRKKNLHVRPENHEVCYSKFWIVFNISRVLLWVDFFCRRYGVVFSVLYEQFPRGQWTFHSSPLFKQKRRTESGINHHMGVHVR